MDLANKLILRGSSRGTLPLQYFLTQSFGGGGDRLGLAQQVLQRLEGEWVICPEGCTRAEVSSIEIG
jgi:hypothetical protein